MTRPNAILQGGPESRIPTAARIRHVSECDGPVKVLVGDCYEHFAPTPDRVVHDGSELKVYSWAHRTYVAE